jgi:hypothetical protein
MRLILIKFPKNTDQSAQEFKIFDPQSLQTASRLKVQKVNAVKFLYLVHFATECHNQFFNPSHFICVIGLRVFMEQIGEQLTGNLKNRTIEQTKTTNENAE